MENKVNIQKRYYTSEVGRDTSKYLGLDGSIIPWEYFKGIIRDDGMGFTSDILDGIEFIYYEALGGCEILTNNGNQYVTKEDLENEVWFVIYKGYRSNLTLNFLEPITSRNYNNVLERYYRGEKGLISSSEKVTHPNGDYTWVEFSFDTRHDDYVGFMSNIKRHMDFIYHYEPDILPHMRKAILTVNEDRFLNGDVGDFFKQAVSLMVDNEKTIEITDIINKFNDLYIPVPTVGNIKLNVSKEYKDFIVVKSK